MRPNRHIKIVRGLSLIFILVMLSPLTGQTRRVLAQDAKDLTLQATVGFDGYCKNNHWLPVHVEVENAGADFDARVQVAYTNGNNGETSTTTELALPTNSRKSFFLNVYVADFMRNLKVRVLKKNSVLLELRLSTSCIASEIKLVGLLSDNPGGFDALKDILPLAGGLRVAELRIADLPDRAQTWQMLDALVVSNVDTASLTPAQRQAMQEWLTMGGKLFVTGGSQWQKTTSGLSDLLPLEAQSTRKVGGLQSLASFAAVDQAPEGETSLTVGTMREKGRVMVTQDGIPVLSYLQKGFGSVYFLAADPTVRPLSDWDAMSVIYQRTLMTATPRPYWIKNTSFVTSGYSYYPYSFSIQQALGALPELSLPSILYICGLLGLYVLVIGPLNFFVLARMKRRELAWVTIPFFVLLFSCAAYGLGFFYRGATPILNRLILVQAWDGEPQAHVNALVGVFSPGRSQYDLEAGQGFMPREYGGYSSTLQAENAWSLLQQDDSMILPNTRVEVGGVKAVITEGSLPALPISHSLVIDLGSKLPSVTGKIKNESEFTLRDAVLVTPAGWRNLGDLAPGAEADTTVSLSIGSTGSPFYALTPADILKINIDYSNIQNRDIKLDQVRQAGLLQAALPTSNYVGVNDGNWGVFLMGWLDESDLPVSLADSRFKTVDTVLYIHSLTPQVKTQGARLTLPSGFFAWESSIPDASPYTAYQIPVNGYVLHFTPAVPISFRTVESLKVSLSSSDRTALVVYIWDWTNKTWVELPSLSVMNISEPEKFVAPNGEVRIKITQDQYLYTDVQSVLINMAVNP